MNRVYIERLEATISELMLLAAEARAIHDAVEARKSANIPVLTLIPGDKALDNANKNIDQTIGQLFDEEP